MVVVPGVRAETKPDVGFTLATAGLLLLQLPVPPLNTTPLAVKVDEVLAHNVAAPLTETTLASGSMLTMEDELTVPSHPPVTV